MLLLSTDIYLGLLDVFSLYDVTDNMCRGVIIGIDVCTVNFRIFKCIIPFLLQKVRNWQTNMNYKIWYNENCDKQVNVEIITKEFIFTLQLFCKSDSSESKKMFPMKANIINKTIALMTGNTKALLDITCPKLGLQSRKSQHIIHGGMNDSLKNKEKGKNAKVWGRV